ncbi:hypothetical protein RJ640_001000 [Escallonia rubra]|uniref:RmlD-like substrate binding domain-containing protein n=1 Tax=Escallonia rubra TaxID=112253 RepID=A0AA88U7Q8_9ASTE|nr:hypothetical protein RJ640_001000 [Escallonia rubra]
MSRKRVLVVGGTGYLGQHLLQAFSHGATPPTPSEHEYDVAFTYHSNPPPQPLLDAVPDSLAFCVDLRTGHGLDAISHAFGQPHVVINCAALSIPRACEMDPTAALSINVPSALVKWLSSFSESTTLLIHLSTDQVYEGTKSFYKEEDETLAVNVYGKTKVAAEQFISANYPNFAILRSSIIFGPQTVSPVPKSLPIQWIDSILAKGDEVDFFHDEFRCPVYVKDVVNIIWRLTNSWISDSKQMQMLLNVGGPDRISRVQMAEAVAYYRGYNTSLIKSVSASSVDRGVKSPADISMDITKLIQTLDLSPTTFADGVRLTLAT